MVSLAKSILRDPALAAMGLGPDRDAGARARRWRATWLALLAGIAAIIAVFFDSFASMVAIWYDSPTFNHAFLVPLISGWLIWGVRERLAACEPRATAWGVPMIAVLGVGWLTGNVASVLVVEQFAVVGMILALFIALLGWRTAWAIAFPLFYLLLAVPFGEFMIAPLQDLTAVFTVFALRLIDIPVHLDGILLTIPTTRFEVAEACAGVRFLIATIALGLLFSYITYRSFARRAFFVALSFIVPIIANGFRALGIVLLAYYSGNRLAVGVDHIVYGWVFFSFVTIILLMIGMSFREKTPAPEAPAAPPAASAAGVPGGARHGRIAAVAVLCLAAAALAPGYKAWTLPAGEDAQAVDLVLPRIGGGWRPQTGAPIDWKPRYPGADATVLQSYVKDGHTVQLFIAYYVRQTQGKEVVSHRNFIADGESWHRSIKGARTVHFGGETVTAEVTGMARGDFRRLAYSWNWVDGRFTASPHIAKLLQVRSLLGGGTPAAAAVVVSTAYDDVPGAADRRLRDFVSNLPWLKRVLADAGGR